MYRNAHADATTKITHTHKSPFEQVLLMYKRHGYKDRSTLRNCSSQICVDAHVYIAYS